MNPYNFNMNIPPPPIAKPMQKAAPVFAPVQSQLGDLEKQVDKGHFMKVLNF